MAIYGIGATYGDEGDVSPEFLARQAAYIGWDEADAPYFHQMFRRITVSDILFIKSYPPQQGLIIKAVGVVTEPQFVAGADDMGVKVGVDWRWTRGPLLIGPLNDKADFMRRGSLFEELNPALQRRVMSLIFG